MTPRSAEKAALRSDLMVVVLVELGLSRERAFQHRERPAGWQAGKCPGWPTSSAGDDRLWMGAEKVQRPCLRPIRRTTPRVAPSKQQHRLDRETGGTILPADLGQRIPSAVLLAPNQQQGGGEPPGGTPTGAPLSTVICARSWSVVRPLPPGAQPGLKLTVSFGNSITTVEPS